jgi:hypothetical protein
MNTKKKPTAQTKTEKIKLEYEQILDGPCLAVVVCSHIINAIAKKRCWLATHVSYDLTVASPTNASNKKAANQLLRSVNRYWLLCFVLVGQRFAVMLNTNSLV